MTDQPPLDPRYDPRYQRGFAAPEPEVWRPQEEVPPAGLIEVPRFERAPDTEKPGADVAAPVDEDEPRNPWLLALLLVSVGLLALGVFVAYSLGANARGADIGADPWQIMWQQLRYQLPSPLITAGLVGIAARIAAAAFAERR